MGLPEPHFVQAHHSDAQHIRIELSSGLLQATAHISPKYLYDALGSKLFEAITCLPEYYPTRTEAAILAANLPDISRQLPPGCTLIDLGAGNCEKAARLFAAIRPAHYVAVDISVEFLRGALGCLQRQFPDLRMSGLGLDFSETLNLPPALDLSPGVPRLLFYPGSSIGNFTPEAALGFLQRVQAACANHPQGHLLIGVDLVKDEARLEAAYDDALGVTAAFNRNLLLHLNQLLGSDFNIGDWKHVAFYNTQAQRIEMHLEAIRPVTAHWTDAKGLPIARRFAQGERIHTENSCKWTIDGFTELLEQAGFTNNRCYTDPHQQFAVFLAQVRNPA